MTKGNNYLHNKRGGKSLRRLASVLQKMVNIVDADADADADANGACCENNVYNHQVCGKAGADQ